MTQPRNFNEELFKLVLQEACDENNKNKFEKLIELNANVNYRHPFYEYNTPLYMALTDKTKEDWVLTLLDINACVGKTEEKFLRESKPMAANIICDNYNYDISMRNKILLTLLRADGAFPENFSTIEQSDPTFFEKFISERLRFHAMIRQHPTNIQEIHTFLNNYPFLKCSYTSNNCCALTTAIKSKNFEAYALLKSKGYSAGIDINLKIEISQLSVNENEQLKTSLGIYFPADHDHVSVLMSETYLCYINNANDRDKILPWYNKLSNIMEVNMLMKVIAKSGYGFIMFDFDNPDVRMIDPNSEGGYGANGITYIDDGRIYIAAQFPDEHEILGVIAHEFCHYSMQLLYNNSAKPFLKSDKTRENAFVEVIQDCEGNLFNYSDDIIAVVYDTKNYNASLRAAELIVRVPHLKARYMNNQDELNIITQAFPSLFDFFNTYTLVHLTEHATSM